MYEIQELKRSKYSWIPDQLDELLLTDCYELLEFHSGDQVTKEWLELILPSSRNKEGKQLGSGEAAAMAWVRFYGGTVASNNLSDIVEYCTKHAMEYISTDDILCLGVSRELISRSKASGLWERMKHCRQKLPDYDFSEAYKRFLNDLRK